jgi:hydrogenase-4 component B
MPVTALAFLAGSVAICGLPPMNGFVSEWLVYLAAFDGGSSLPIRGAVTALAVLPVLALVGGLAVACFVKVFGVVFLGEPRSACVETAHEAPLAMRLAMLLGALLCLVIGLWPALVLQLVTPASQSLLPELVAPALDDVAPLRMLSRFGAGLLLLGIGLALVRRAILRRREVRTSSTWGCGYRGVTARMQYTAASFAQPLLAPFASIVPRRTHGAAPSEIFPARAEYEEHLGDVAGERWILPAVRWIVASVGRLRILQQGRVQVYLAYVFVTLIVLLVWQLGPAGR